MREKIRTRQYARTLRAEEEMDNDDLTLYEIKRSIFTGVILECQRDWRTAEWKYRIREERPPSSTGETERDGKTNPMKIGVLMVWQK
jgi:hypothetical protein